MEKENVKNTNKKIIFTFIAIILLIGIIAIIVIKLSYKGNLENNEIIKKYNSNSLIAVKKDDMYGYIDTNGKFKIEPQFISAKDFDGDYAIVTTKDDAGKKVYAIIDASGNIKASSTSYNGIKKNSISGYWLVDDKLYDLSFNLASNENIANERNNYYSYNNRELNQAGIIDPYGKKTYTYNLKENEYSLGVFVSKINKYQKNRYCSVSISAKKYAIVNCDTGKVIYDFVKKNIFPTDYNVFEVSDIDSNGTNPDINMYIHDDEIVYSTEDKNINLKNHDDKDFGYMSIEDNSQSFENRYKYFLYDSKKIVSELPKSEYEIDFSNVWEEYTKIKKFGCNTGYGLMKDEKVIVPCEWSNIEFLYLDNYLYLLSNKKNYILTKKDDKISIYDINNNKVVKELNTSYVSQYTNSILLEYKDKDTNLTTLYNPLNNKEIKFDELNINVSCFPNYFYAIKKGQKDYYNMDFQLIYSEQS